MIELVVIGALAFCAFVVVGTLVAVGSLVTWILWLPFRLLGWTLRGIGFLLALPFMLLAGAIGVIAFGVGAVLLFFPLLPLLLLGLGVVWLVRRSAPRPVTS